MAPIKFEENIKDKLEKRTLSPSSESWSKLSDRLDADQKKPKNPLFWWFSIAAGLIIMIAVSAHFFNSNRDDALPKMVEENKKVEPFKANTQKQNEINSIELAKEEDLVKNKDESLLNKEESHIINYKKVRGEKSKIATKLSNKIEPKTKTNTTKQEDFIKQKAQNLLDEVIMENAVAEALKELKSENTTVTDREIDSLLKIASKELFKQKLQKETSKTVDANALLMSVEDEMGQSFRSKVFEALKNSYDTVKTAVADRNN